MRTERQKRFAVIGGLCGALYLAGNRLLPTLPEFLLGGLVGLALVFMVMGLLPVENWQKLRKWKRRGE